MPPDNESSRASVQIQIQMQIQIQIHLLIQMLIAKQTILHPVHSKFATIDDASKRYHTHAGEMGKTKVIESFVVIKSISRSLKMVVIKCVRNLKINLNN